MTPPTGGIATVIFSECTHKDVEATCHMLRIRCLYSKFFQSTHSEELYRSLKTICSFLFTSKGTIEEVIRIFLNHLTSVGAWAALRRLATDLGNFADYCARTGGEALRLATHSP